MARQTLILQDCSALVRAHIGHLETQSAESKSVADELRGLQAQEHKKLQFTLILHVCLSLAVGIAGLAILAALVVSEA